MKRFIITTMYDEILCKYETMTADMLDEDAFHNGLIRIKKIIYDKKFGYVQIMLSNDEKLKKYETMAKEKTGVGLSSLPQGKKFAKKLITENILLTAQDIVIYRILISHYINNQIDNEATITLDEIHNMYRGKYFKYMNGKDRYDGNTLQAYLKSIDKLSSITIYLRFADSTLKSLRRYKKQARYSFQHKMLVINNRDSGNNILDNKIKYSLMDMGRYYIESKQYGQFTPYDIYRLRFNQIDIFNMAIYISRIIVINRKQRKSINLRVCTILSRFMKYDRCGFSLSLTYYEYLVQLDTRTRNKKIQQLKKQLMYILDLFVKEKKIKSYELVGKFNYKFIKEGELSINIVFIKR